MNQVQLPLEAAEGASAGGGADEAPAAAIEPAARRTSRGRLFRKYLVLILSLMTIALLASGTISIYFSYQEHKSALASLQHEKALAAASRIEQYIRRIEQQLHFAALPQLDRGDIESRRIEFLKLLLQAPEISDIALLDGTGREQVAVSRLGMDSINSGRDRSQEPAFINAARSRTWFSPVYFRKETEPYMTMSIRPARDGGPVTVADANLKFIWDVVSRIKIGERGKAYVVDRRGFLIADPDIGLVLRMTDMSRLGHVAAALGTKSDAASAMVSSDTAGTPVLSSSVLIETLDWHVFVEQPVSEVYAKLNASILRTGLLLLAGLVISALAALALARGMVRPIRTLEAGAQRIGAGELEQKIEIHTGDELEALANQFNRMSDQLRESYAGLERKVEARTSELQNSLEQQTAISEILRVISSSPTNVQPVLQAVAERAAHLCNAPYARVMIVDGGRLLPMAQYPIDPGLITAPVPYDRTSIAGRAAVDRATVHIADVVPVAEVEFPGAVDNLLRVDARAVLAVPLIREGGAYGGIILFRREPGLFSPDQVTLVETFARQAAIAIDNVRLFNETKEALEQQTAISEILRAISSSPTDVQPVLDAVAERAARLCDASAASIYLTDGNVLRHLASRGPSADPVNHLDTLPIDRNSIAGRAVLEQRMIQVTDLLAEEEEYPASYANAQRLGHRAIIVVPLLREGRAFGTILLRRQEVRPFGEREVALLTTFGDQAAIALENVRLFNESKEAMLEIQEKSRQVEIASQHKMQFLANMSHELRTPLNAILGYSELMSDGIYGPLGERVQGVLERVQQNGRHLLGLINDVLDLSKIDAGQLKLAPDQYSMSGMVKATLASTESLARAKGLSLECAIADDLPPGYGDERRLMQVMLNVVGNAIKFTDAGSVKVIANAADDMFIIEVCDTGAGISPADQGRIFEEFQQVDLSSTRKQGGTGLGLAIARRIVELHGGQITVSSALGAGSTFRITIPVRIQQQGEAA